MQPYVGKTLVLAATAAVAWVTLGCGGGSRDGAGPGWGQTTTTFGTSTTTLAATSTTLGGANTTLGGVSTSVPSGSSTTATTVLPPTTGPTIVEPAMCAITWRVINAVTLGALQFDTDYNAAPGDIAGVGDFVECVDLTGAIETFYDDDAARRLTVGFISVPGFAAPTQLMRCTFIVSTRDPVISDFEITVTDATDPSITPVEADVVIANICCTGASAGCTTTTSTTSTTVQPGVRIPVALLLADAVEIGALQLVVDYSGAAGGFWGTGEAVACGYPLEAFDLARFYNDRSRSTLAAGFVSVEGVQVVTPPFPLGSCHFLPADDSVTADDFVVTVIEATDPDLVPIDPLPRVTIQLTD